MTTIAAPSLVMPRLRLPRWQMPWEKTREAEDTAVVLTIGNPSLLGGGTFSTTNGQTSVAVSGNVIPSASLVIVVVLNGATSGAAVPTQVSDGTTNLTTADNSAVLTTSQPGAISLWSFYYAVGATKTFTATIPSSNCTVMYVYSVSSAASTSWLDAKGTSNSSSSSAMLVTTSGNAAQADELSIGAYGYSQSSDVAPTTWPGTGYTALNGASGNDNATRHVRILIQYKLGVTAGSTVSSNGTMSATGGITRTVTTYKGAAAAASLVTEQRRVYRNSLLRRHHDPRDRVSVFMNGLNPSWSARQSGVLVPEYS